MPALKARLSDAFDRFLEGVPDNRQVVFDDDGWRLKTDPAEHPDPAQSNSLVELHRWLDARSRSIRLADMLIEVENDLGFSVHFQRPGERVDPGEVCALLAAIRRLPGGRYRCRSSTGEDWRPCPRALLRLGDLLHAHVVADVIARAASVLVVLCSGKIQPHVRHDIILRHALAVDVPKTEGVLRLGYTLVSGPPKPLNCFRVVPLDTLPFGVHGTEVVLRDRMATVGREVEPPNRLGVVAHHTPTCCVRMSQGSLRIGMSLVGRQAQPFDGLDVVLWHAATDAVRMS